MNKTFKKPKLLASNPISKRLKHKRIRKALENLGTEMLIPKRIQEVLSKMNEHPCKVIRESRL